MADAAQIQKIKKKDSSVNYELNVTNKYNEDKIEIGKAVKKYADKNNLPQSFVEVFAKIKPFKLFSIYFSSVKINLMLN